MPSSSIAPLKAPYPFFGGKRAAAQRIWDAFGDPGGYVEPFCGSAAVLLARPPCKGRRVETLNDADGWLVNTWRAIQLSPDEVAKHAYGPVTEIDYHARLAWLQARRDESLVSWLEGDPEHHDPKAAGWWLYVAACGIGDPWNPGPWHVVDGHLVKTQTTPNGANKELPHLGNAGRGVNRVLPHLGNAGQGVNRALPHLGDAGQGALVTYMRALSDRLQRVRITAGDWKRVLKPSVIRATAGNPRIAVLLDPPYATSGDLYASTNGRGDQAHKTISAEAREWALQAPPEYRIILCGYDNEHDDTLAHGWTVINSQGSGGAGYSTNAENGKRERLWLSPSCIREESLLDLLDDTAA